MASVDPEVRDEEHVPGEEEDTGPEIAPIVRLEEVAVITGEEDEDTLLDLKAKLYRFDNDGNEWKERGSGTVKFLMHNVNGRLRLLMRQSKTLKICANHLIIAGMTIQEHAGNDKSCVWQLVEGTPATGSKLRRFDSYKKKKLITQKYFPDILVSFGSYIRIEFLNLKNCQIKSQ
ncbi:ran-binding protein 1 homolog b-like [Spinacia oleracea]|uniref:Ran-binding protein 1 homolog b-like n=1 Tax=Spinacia oleracea TaxID=3562 RepID=A0ABM3RS87_SPIOL|nr:ran-binding protein 1 homolog b-like [Spinacia oleracea]